MADPSSWQQEGQHVVFEHWSPPRSAQTVPHQPQQQEWTTSLPFHDQSMQWESQDSSTEPGSASGWTDSQGSHDPSQWSQEQWTSSYSPHDSYQQDALPHPSADSQAPPPSLPYAEPHHQHAQEPFPSYQTTAHATFSSSHDSVDPRYPSQRFKGPSTRPSSTGIEPNGGNGAEQMMMEQVQEWSQEQYVGEQEYFPMDTTGGGAGNSVASSPNDQFVFAGAAPQQSSPQFQDYAMEGHSVAYHPHQHQQQHEQYASPSSASAPILSPTSTSSLGLRTPSSSISYQSSNPTSPAYSQFQSHLTRSRQHSLDSAPPSASSRPQPLRRLSQSSSFAAHPYAQPPTPTSSRSHSSLPNSRRGSITLPPSSARPPSQQRPRSPSVPLHPRRRASQPSLSAITLPTNTAPRRPSYSASSSPVQSRFGFPALPSPISARGGMTRPPTTTETIREKPPPPCSMFDPPLVRRFGVEGSGGGRAEGMAVGLGMEMGSYSGVASGGQQAMMMMQEEEEERSYAPAMPPRLVKETTAFLESSNQLLLGSRTVLIFSPKLIQPSPPNSLERHILFPQPTALLLGSSWTSELSIQPSSEIAPRPFPLLSAPSVHLCTTPQRILHAPSMPSEWMTQEGTLLHPEEVGEHGGRVIAGRVTGEGVQTPEEGAEESKKAMVAVVFDGVEDVKQRLLGVFPGPEMQVQRSSAEGFGVGEQIHHGSLISITNRMKDPYGYPLFLSVSGSSSTFPTIDWRAMTGGTPRSYSASSVLTARSNAWDAFVVYRVEPEKMNEGGGERERMRAVRAGYPAPPVGALPFDPFEPRAICYDQPIVLQCISTAAVSPVLLIRRHHSGSLILGTSNSSLLSDSPNTVPVASHLPLAFQFADLSTALGLSDADGGGGAVFDTFLEGKEGTVAPYPATGGRIYATSPEMQEAAPTLAEVRRKRALGQTASGSASVYSRGAGGGGVGTSGMRRRVQSMSSFKPPLDGERRDGRPSSSFSTGEQETDTWMIDCGDSCIWSILPVDVARHTFYIPPSTINSRALEIRFKGDSHRTKGSARLPATSLGPHIPMIHEYDVPTAFCPWITLHGSNLTSNLSIYFSTYRSPEYILRSPSMILVPPPPRSLADTPVSRGSFGGKRIALGREDGVLWLTSVMYREEGM